MSLFNNLRRRIVQKLLRPEDGYIYTGYVTKFYCNRKTAQYVMERTTPLRTYYYLPTLAGWKEISAANTDMDEVEFTEWVFGILNNVHDEYSQRLENITRKELKQFEKKDKQLMINKQSFIDIMNALDHYWNDLRSLQGVMDVLFEDNMFTKISDGIVDALIYDLEPDLEFFETPVIYQWMFDFDFGRDEKAAEGIDGYSLTSAEELYDYLMHKKNLQETLDKFENM